ncbi:hypothetical protein ACIGXI_34730 [Kitasatospora aureofaciens]|uniref:hypothetical protein n=1 Tax=Kitasatospora aureofaciens TaxID=1894 RepID=UPI0037C9B25A
MKRLARSLAVAATAGSLMLLAAPASQAAAPIASTGSCVTFSPSNSIGNAQLTACSVGGNNYHVTGYLSNTLPYGGWDGPYYAQVDLQAGSTRVGVWSNESHYNVPVTTDNFDVTVSLPSQPTGAVIWQPWR